MSHCTLYQTVYQVYVGPLKSELASSPAGKTGDKAILYSEAVYTRNLKFQCNQRYRLIHCVQIIHGQKKLMGDPLNRGTGWAYNGR